MWGNISDLGFIKIFLQTKKPWREQKWAPHMNYISAFNIHTLVIYKG